MGSSGEERIEQLGYQESIPDPTERAVRLFDTISEEVYYGFNMRVVLSELARNHPSRFLDVEWAMNRCRRERLDRSERRDDA